jgi:thioredoxin reductase
MSDVRERNGKDILRTYVVTVTMEHFFEIQARSEVEAERRAVVAATGRWGAGRNPRVIETEERS